MKSKFRVHLRLCDPEFPFLPTCVMAGVIFFAAGYNLLLIMMACALACVAFLFGR